MSGEVTSYLGLPSVNHNMSKVMTVTIHAVADVIGNSRRKERENIMLNQNQQLSSESFKMVLFYSKNEPHNAMKRNMQFAS